MSKNPQRGLPCLQSKNANVAEVGIGSDDTAEFTPAPTWWLGSGPKSRDN